MWAKPKYSGAACVVVFTEESISPDSPSWRTWSSTWAGWIPTSGSSPLVWHQLNQRFSC